MTKQTINIGSVANDGTGDPLRTAFDKCNDNFTELYAGIYGLRSVNTQNANYNFSLSDLGGIVAHTDTAATYTYTIPPVSSVAFPTTYTPHIKILNNSSAVVTVAPGSGVTLTRADGVSGTGSRTVAENSTAIIYQVSSDSWVIEGGALS